MNLECSFRIPSYSRWWADCDMRPNYRRYRKNVRLIGGGEPGRRFLLKDATHMFHLDRFLERRRLTHRQRHDNREQLFGSRIELGLTRIGFRRRHNWMCR